MSQNSQENTCARASLLTKLQAQPATLSKKTLWHRCFPVNFAKFQRTPFLTEHFRWLLLYMTILETLLLILKICLSVEIICWNTPLRIAFKNLRSFRGKYLWRSSILVKAFSLRFTVILLMILKPMVSRNFITIL